MTDNAHALSADDFRSALVEGFKLASVPKPDQAVSMLAKTGLERLLWAGIERGRITERMASDELGRLGDALKTRRLQADEIKLGILALDDAAQLFAGALGKDGGFRYDHSQNRARDLLITFARSLHR